MTKLTELGGIHLRSVYTADQAMKAARASIRAWAREQCAERVRSYQAAVDHEIRLAIDAGVPRSQILEAGLSTKSWSTLYESLARTAAVSSTIDGHKEGPQLSGPQFLRNDDGTIALLLLGEAFDKSEREHGWRAGEATSKGLTTWQLDKEGYSIAASDFLPDLGRRHPVGAWAMQNLRITREWAANN